MVDLPERIWVWKYTGGFNRGEWIEHKAYSDSVEYIRADLATLSDAVAEREAEPVASVAEVRADGQRLYNTVYPSDALDKFPIGTLLYTTPPTSELEAENARLKAILSETIKALDVVFEDTQARTKAGMTVGINGHPTLSIGTLHVVAQARFAARRVREGGKVDG